MYLVSRIKLHDIHNRLKEIDVIIWGAEKSIENY